MGRPTPLIPAPLLAVAVIVSTGCGEPVAILGDTPGLMRIVAGVPDQPGREIGSEATETLLRFPAGVDMDLAGVLYVADRDNRRILAVASSGAVRVVTEDRGCTGECFAEITDLAVDGAGALVVADEVGRRLWRVDVSSGTRTVLAGTGNAGTTPDGEPASTSPIQGPRGVAVGEDGAVFFAEGRSHRVRSILPDGSLATVAGTGEAGFDGDGGPAKAAMLNFPAGLDAAAGMLFIVDAGNHRVRAVDLVAGTIATVAGNGASGFRGDGGDPLAASFREVRDVAATDDGRTLYVADSGNHRIRIVTLTSSLINTFAGNGETEFAGDLLDAGATQLRQPQGVATSPFGLVIISDTGHHIVWRTPTGL